MLPTGYFILVERQKAAGVEKRAKFFVFFDFLRLFHKSFPPTAKKKFFKKQKSVAGPQKSGGAAANK